MALIYIGVGSNIRREESLRRGITALRDEFGALRLSAVYESAAVGFDGEDFYNLVVEARSELSIGEIVATLKRIEFANGRALDARKFSARMLDLDLLCYDDCVVSTPVVLPRADILECAFVLRPFAELNPDYRHPVAGLTLAELWQAYDVTRQPLRIVQLDWQQQTDGVVNNV